MQDQTLLFAIDVENDNIKIIALDHRFGQNSNPRRKRKRPEQHHSLTVVALSDRNDDQGRIITAYHPNPDEWEDGFRIRRRTS